MRYLRWILIEENSEQQFLKIWDLKSPLSLKVAYCFNFKNTEKIGFQISFWNLKQQITAASSGY